MCKGSEVLARKQRERVEDRELNDLDIVLGRDKLGVIVTCDLIYSSILRLHVSVTLTNTTLQPFLST